MTKGREAQGASPAEAADLRRCARVVMEKCARLRTGERVLVVTDPMRDPSVANALVDAALASGSEAVLVVIPARRTTPQEPPPAAAAAMAATDVAFLCTTYSHTHSSARVRAQQTGARVISMPGVTRDGFVRTLSVDIEALAQLTNRLSERVSRANACRIVTTLGTDLLLELGHPATAIDGICEQRGELDFLPPGLFLNVPYEGGVTGRAVVDGAITQIGKLYAPVTMTFTEGRLTGVDGGDEAARLRELLASLEDDAAYRFAAWGIGTNPGATLAGQDPAFEGERAFGWCHVSTGTNASFPGGAVRAKIHLDGLISRATVYLDGEAILRDGQFQGELAADQSRFRND